MTTDTIAPMTSPFFTGFSQAKQTIYRYSGYDHRVRAGLKRIGRNKGMEPVQVYEWKKSA